MYQLALHQVSAQYTLTDGDHRLLRLNSTGRSLVISTHATRHYRLDIGPRGGLTITPLDSLQHAEWINAPHP